MDRTAETPFLFFSPKECGTYNTVEDRFCSLQGKSSSTRFNLFPFRSKPALGCQSASVECNPLPVRSSSLVHRNLVAGAIRQIPDCHIPGTNPLSLRMVYRRQNFCPPRMAYRRAICAYGWPTVAVFGVFAGTAADRGNPQRPSSLNPKFSTLNLQP